MRRFCGYFFTFGTEGLTSYLSVKSGMFSFLRVLVVNGTL